MPDRCFFILGCQRSGTTLLRLILECHSQIYCYDEITAYRALAARDFSASGAAERVGFKIPRWTEQLTQARLSDAGQAESAERFYGGHKLLFLLRDARDTVASMLRLGADGGSWLSVWGQRILDAKLRDPDFRQRYTPEIARLDSTADRLAVQGALYWKYKTQAYFDYRALGFPVIPVRYRTLVSAPEPALRRVVTFLGLDWQDALIHPENQPHGERFASGLTVGDTDPTRSIDTRSLRRGETLTPRQQGAILSIAGDLNQQVIEIT